MNILNKIVCPYCLKTIDPQKTEGICSICGAKKALSIIRPFSGKNLKCPAAGCEGQINACICPSCGSVVSKELLNYKSNIRIIVAGHAASGKTCFMTSLIHELRCSSESSLVLEPADDITRQAFTKNEHDMFDRGLMVPATALNSWTRPGLWRLSRLVAEKKRSSPAQLVSFIDPSGEQYQSVGAAPFTFFGGTNDSIIFLIDALTLPKAVDTVSQDVRTASMGNREYGVLKLSETVAYMASLIRQSCGINPGKLIRKDIAVVVSKIDTIMQSNDSFREVRRRSPHLLSNGFVQADGDAVSRETRDWLIQAGAEPFLRTVENEFETEGIRYFALSSLGGSPGSIIQAAPHRVADPVIWILSRRGVLPVIK